MFHYFIAYTATSCSQTPLLLHSPTRSLIPSLSFSPSLSPLSSSSLSFFHPPSSLPPSQSFPFFMTTLITPSNGKSSYLFTEYKSPLIVSTKCSTVITVTNVITIMNTVNTSTATNVPGKNDNGCIHIIFHMIDYINKLLK